MKIVRICSIILLLLYSNNKFAQACFTSSDKPDFLQSIPANQRVPNAANYVVRVFFHIINDPALNNGHSLSEINIALNILKTDFEPHNICVSLLGIETINSASLGLSAGFFNDNDNDGKFDNVLNASLNPHYNAIDIYVLPNGTTSSGGKAADIISTSLVLGGIREGMNVINSPILSHEFGHCIGLYHTHHGVCNFEQSICPDFPGNPNCATCGDFVCDTPPDPSIGGNVAINNCLWNNLICVPDYLEGGAPTNTGNWNPMINLIMSYAPLSCVNSFTPGQGQRMRDVISNSTLLQQVIVPDDLVFTNFSTILGQDLLYDVRNSITAENSVFVNPSSKLTYRAGHYILLDPGFEVNNGGFEATINTVCSTIDFNNSARSSDSKKNIELDRIDEMSFEVYPNPNNGIFTIESKELTSSIIDVYDLLGQKVKSIQISSTKTLIDLSNFPKGVYLLIYTDKNKKSNKRIILE